MVDLRSLANGDKALFLLLDACLGRLLRRESLAEEPNADQVRHIVDWLRSALLNDEPWLKNVDDRGRPKKLMKFGSVEAIAREADKAMLKAAQKLRGVTLVEGDEELVEMLDDGYYVVRLLTPAALDRESAEMQHCIGNGGYDERLNDGKHTYLSLRDAQGKPHVTLEIVGYEIVQYQGKQNQHPHKKYSFRLKHFLQRRKLKYDESPIVFGYVIDRKGKVYDINGFRDGDVFHGILNLSGCDVDRLPNNFKVTGHLDISRCPIIELPRGLSIGGSLYLDGTPVESLPEDLKIGISLSIDDTNILSLPDNLAVPGELRMRGTKIREFPESMCAPRSLFADGSLLSRLPDHWRELDYLSLADSMVSSLPSRLYVRNALTLSRCPIEELPQGLHVSGVLVVDRTKLRDLPQDLFVGKALDIRGTKISEIPSSMKECGSLLADDSRLSKLPDNFTIKFYLNLKNCPISELPKKLRVGHDLVITGTQVKTIPTDADVGTVVTASGRFPTDYRPHT